MSPTSFLQQVPDRISAITTGTGRFPLVDVIQMKGNTFYVSCDRSDTLILDSERGFYYFPDMNGISCNS
jgi:hypothetical protein